MKWIDPKDELPPQGKKILHFKSGDMKVVHRMGEYWFPLPFHDSKFTTIGPPDLWCDIIPPKGYTGKLFFRMKGEDEHMEMDYLEIHHNKFYKQIIEMSVEMFSRHE
jgi:hypothetical protein